jgi:hypothetical protein
MAKETKKRGEDKTDDQPRDDAVMDLNDSYERDRERTARANAVRRRLPSQSANGEGTMVGSATTGTATTGATTTTSSGTGGSGSTSGGGAS